MKSYHIWVLVNKLTWLKIKAQIGKKYIESLMPAKNLDS